MVAAASMSSTIAVSSWRNKGTYIKADYDEELLSLLRDAYREAGDGQA